MSGVEVFILGLVFSGVSTATGSLVPGSVVPAPSQKQYDLEQSMEVLTALLSAPAVPFRQKEAGNQQDFLPLLTAGFYSTRHFLDI